MRAKTKRQPGRPRNPPPPPEVMPWHSKAIAEPIDEILMALEVPAIDEETRGIFERKLYREKYFHDDARGHIIFLIRCITESTGNEGALIGPVVRAVSGVLRPEWTSRGLELIEAFDKIPLMSLLATLRDLFGAKDAGHHLEAVIRRKLYAILELAKPCKAAKAKLPPKPPQAVTRIPAIEKAMSLGRELLALRASISSNTQFGREVRKRFPGVDQITASEAMKVARAYGARPEIYRRLSWIALFELSSPKMSQSVRQAIEVKILAGQSVTALQIRRARGPLKGGSPKRTIEPAARMAA